jgi:hypothetical protein
LSATQQLFHALRDTPSVMILGLPQGATYPEKLPSNCRYLSTCLCEHSTIQRDGHRFKVGCRTRAEFSYHITPATISIISKGRLSVGKNLEAVLRKIEYWHQAPVTKFRIMARQGQGTWLGVRWDGG